MSTSFFRSALLVFFLSITSSAYATLVGETTGNFQVSPSGAATYSVPIQVPPGINDIQPNLSLNYNSQGGNGLLGVGWNIGGLSAITRCPATKVQDTFIDGVDFDSNDKFCLDGQRLIAISGSYGSNGTEYRTAINSFSKIVSYGSAGNGPAYFKVWTKSGQIMEYATTDDSRIEAQGKTDVLIWALSRAEDRNGNYLTISYAEDNANGESYPTDIYYTGNTNQGITPDNHIHFTYEDKTDILIRYVGGSLNKTTKRLSRIDTYVGTILVKSYQLAYKNNELTNKLQLTAIEECTAGSGCLSPIMYTWNDSSTLEYTGQITGPSTYIDTTIFSRADTSISRIKFGDFNGDGRTDIYYINGGDTKQGGAYVGSAKPDTIYFANENGTYTRHNTGPSTRVEGPRDEANASLNRVKFGDFNGDGLTDVYYVRGQGEFKNDHVYLSNGDGTFEKKNSGPSTFVSNINASSTNNSLKRIVIDDFNGDGRSDVYRINGGGYSADQKIICPGLQLLTGECSRDNNKPDTVWLSKGNGSFTSTSKGPKTWIDDGAAATTSTSLNRIRFGDFNGDGMTDVYHIKGTGSSDADTVYLSRGNGRFTKHNTGPNTHIKGSSLEKINFSLNSISFGDFNGDGLTDVYYARGWNSSLPDYIYLSKGDATFTSEYNGPETYINGSNYEEANSSISRIKFGDFNGDGQTDVYYINGGGSSVDSIYLAKGDGTFTSEHSGPATYINGADLYQTNSSIKRVRFGDFNGDGITDVYYINGDASNAADTIYPGGTNRLLISEITNSLSTRIKISHAPITDSSVYTKETNAAYPEQNVQAPIYVVTQTSMDNGLKDGNGNDGQAITRYTYRGMKVHLQGRGSLGFAGMDILNVTGDIKTSIEYRQDYPFVGMPKRTEKTVISTGQSISLSYVPDDLYVYKSPYTGNLLGPVAPYAGQIVETIYDLNSQQTLSTTTTTSTYNDYGNPETTNKEVSGNGETFTEVTTNTLTNDTTNWCIGMTTQSDVAITAITSANTSSITRSTSFSWDNTKCRLDQSTILPGEGDSLEMTIVYGYDAFGNRSSENVSGPVDAARTALTNFTSNNTAYPDGQFITTITNALGHSETREYDARFGVVTKLTGPNNIDTCFEYDELGRQLLERQYCGTPQETITTTSYAWCDTSCPQYASYMVTTQQTGSAPVTVYYDKLNRKLRKSVVGFSGNPIYIDTKYDDKGHIAETSEPYFDSDFSYWSVYTYDVLGRVETLKPPHLDPTQRVTTVYNGYTTTVTDVKGRQRSETEDAMGRTRVVTDAIGNTITYAYDAAGNLSTTTDSEGNAITLTYDKRDRKIAMSDPDMGDWSYSYNTFGELLTQTDAKGQVTTLTYDLLGRMISRDTAEGESTWTYDTATKGIGKLARMDGAGGSAREFIYDTLGRPSQVIDHIDMDTFTTSRTYDYAGRLDTVTYPANFAVQHIYTGNGYLQQVQSTDATPVVYWKADSMNARGQILDSTLGNGVHTSRAYSDATGWIDGVYTFDSAMTTVQLNAYSFDAVGNLVSRSDQRQGLTESFTYDDLDRVLTADIAGGSGTYVPRNYSYDALGNITSKSDVGNYLYGENGAGPHAVTQAGTHTYDYDANGNMISGAGRTIGYTSFNKPNVITDSGTTVTFTYGADKSRILKVVGSKRTIYVGLGAEGNALYERETDGSSVKHRHYIYAGGGQAVAIHTNDGTSDAMEYLHRDHLGSIEAITDASGQITERISFDVWGKQRSVDWSDVPLGNYIVNSTNLGFTGHESIPEVGYIHMNGRVYDPVIGRFLSADPNVQSDTDTQSYSRYSYVQNNPLRYTDPTGYFINAVFDVIESVVGPIVSTLHDFFNRNGKALMAAYLAYVTGGMYSGWTASAVSSATSAAATALANGGDFTTILRAAAMGALTGAVFGKINEHFGDTWNAERVTVTSVAGGITAGINGGKFEDGFSTAFTTSSTRLIYGEVSKKYNPSGKPHLLQEGDSDVGKQLKEYKYTPAQIKEIENGLRKAPLGSDHSWFMKAVGKGPFMDAFGEFHDGLHDLPFIKGDQLTLIATMPASYVLTVTAAMQPYTQYLIYNNARMRSGI